MIYSVAQLLLSIKNIHTKWIFMRLLSEKNALDHKYGLVHSGGGEVKLMRIY